MKTFLEKLGKLDRRWLYLAMAAAMVLPLISPFNLPFTTSKMVRDIYDTVDALPSGSKVLVSADFEPASAPELYPFMIAIFNHLFQKDIKVVVMSLWPAAQPLADSALEETAIKRHNKIYGKDFVNLGYKEGRLTVIRGVVSDLRTFYPKDARGIPVDRMPVMDEVYDIKDFKLFIDISAGDPGIKEWVQQAQSRINFTMVGATTAVSALDFIPYYQAGQIRGLAAGMRGAAEYEILLDQPAAATSGMDAQNMGHLLIIFAIILGNIVYFAEKKKNSKKNKKEPHNKKSEPVRQ